MTTSQPAPRTGLIAFTSDFGVDDGYVGQVHAAIAAIDPRLRVIDVSHAVPPQAVAVGSLVIAAAAGALGPGAVHLGVVDPGVGSARAGMVARVGDCWFVGPDNGLWSDLVWTAEVRRRPVRAWQLTEARYWRRPVAGTFHGRDIFGPVAAQLARGVSPDAFGTPLAAPLRLPRPRVLADRRVAIGHIIHVDRFGNAITDVAPSDLPGTPERTSVSAGAFRVQRIARTYADVAPGAMVALFGSFGSLELAQRNGNAAATCGLRPGDVVRLSADHEPDGPPPE